MFISRFDLDGAQSHRKAECHVGGLRSSRSGMLGRIVHHDRHNQVVHVTRPARPKVQPLLERVSSSVHGAFVAHVSMDKAVRVDCYKWLVLTDLAEKRR